MSGRDTNKPDLPDDPRIIKTINGLSNGLRKFLKFEWFYSGLDRDYFNPVKAEFALALRELDLGNLTSLTRTEWSVIRSRMLMGRKPRRLSQAFLRKERERLHRYRKDVREQQISGMAKSNSETRGLYNIPAPLFVGQRVTAIHSGKGHVLAVGSILTCDPEAGEYRVQFDLPELGVEVCNDTDIMPHGVPRMLITRGDGTPNLITSPERGNFPSATKFEVCCCCCLSLSSNISRLVAHTYTHTHKQELTRIKIPEDEDEYSRNLLERSKPHPVDSDVRLLVAVTPLLKRKEHLIRALDETNREASAAKVLSAELKQRFAWILVNLEETNKVLQPLMIRFSARFSKGAADSWTDSFADMVGRTSRAISRRGGTQASILNRESNSMANNRTNIDRSRMDIRERISGALRVLIGLRFCAEDSVSNRTATEALSKSRDELRPACSTNMNAYNQTCKLLDTLCAFLNNTTRSG